MLFEQFIDDGLGCASYLVGDTESAEAVLIDPAYAIEPYLAAASRHRVRIVRVLETHTHADHVSGHGRLALEHGVPVSVHPAAGAEFPHEPLADGQEIHVGAVTVRVVHTPGHRPEHCAFEIFDEGTVAAVLTGDSLFVGDTARPDLAVEAVEGARDLYASLQRLLELPDEVAVYPGHVAGSLCGVAMSDDPSTTVGRERRHNHRLLLDDEAEFVADAIGATAVARPPNMERIVELNRGPFVSNPSPVERAPDIDGALLLDVRPFEAFAAGHARGAINVPVDGSSFATKAGFVLAPDDRVVLVGSEDEVERAARGLRSIGVLELAGWLEPAEGDTLAPVRVDELDGLLASGEVDLVDVREKHERDDGYIPGSRNVPYRLLRVARPPFERKQVVTICESGPRAAIAASVLRADGIDARPVSPGGVSEWRRRGGETVEFRRCGGV